MIRSPRLLAAAALAALLALSGAAAATPLDVRRLPAGAEGVGHLDVDALRRTTLYKLVSARVAADSSQVDIDPAVRPLVEHLVSSARAVSLWVGVGDTGALIIELADPRATDALLEAVPHTDRRVAGHPVRVYAMDGDRTATALAGSFLVVADDDPSLTRTLKVLSGKARSLPRARLPQGAGGAGVFFFAALGGKLLDRVKQGASSRTLQVDMTSLTIEVAELRGELRATVRAVTTSADAARKIKSVIDGLVALASLADEAKELQPILQRLSVTTAGGAVEVELAIPPAVLLEIARSAR